jgi:hypothetical protein
VAAFAPSAPSASKTASQWVWRKRQCRVQKSNKTNMDDFPWGRWSGQRINDRQAQLTNHAQYLFEILFSITRYFFNSNTRLF